MGFDESIVEVYFALMESARRYYHDERAHDLAADTVVRALESRDRYDASRPLLTWCRAIMRNLWMNTEARLSVTHTQRLGDWDEPGGEEADQLAMVNEIMSVVRDMEARSVSVATLVQAAKGYSLAEIAADQGVPLGTVKRRVHDARRMLATLVNVKQTRPYEPNS